MTDNELMLLAVEQLRRSPGHPKVGAVISKEGNVLSTGFRGETPGKHAERAAIEKLDSDQLRGATLYTTLEPCAEVDPEQPTKSCSELIAESGIAAVSIGALDPNGRIYAKGMNHLREKGVSITLFSPALRDEIERSTFRYDDFSGATGSGKRRVRSVKNGKTFSVRFSREDERTITFRLSPLSMPLDRIDVVAGRDSVRLVPDLTDFKDVLDPLLYQDPSHFARLAVGEIAVIADSRSTMVLLIQIQEITSTDIVFRWEVRNRLNA